MIFFGGGSLNTPKIGKRKKEFTNINLRGSKTKKTWRGGGCHGQNGSQNFRFHKCYDICFYFCDKHPLMGKNASKVWKKIFSKFLTSFFGCCKRPNIWFVTENEMMEKVEISIWNIWIRIKWEAKFQNP